MKKTIERIVKYASQISEPDQIILFGSFANNTNNVHSDLDLLVISDDITSKKQTAEKIKQYAQEFAIAADVLIFTKDQIKRESEQPFSFIATVLKSGKIVYQNEKNS